MPWAAHAFSARAMISAFDDMRLVNRFVEAIARAGCSGERTLAQATVTVPWCQPGDSTSVDLRQVEAWIRARVALTGAIELAHERPWATVLRVPVAERRWRAASSLPGVLQ